LGTGESGLPFYDLDLQVDINKDAWATYALGHPTNIGIAAKPTYLVLAKLQNLGVPGFLLQATLLFLCLMTSGLSIYFITKEVFPKLEQKFYLLAPLFYWFNPFSLVNVWNRFLNNFMIFYAFLPFSLLLFLKGIRKRKYHYSLLLGLTSVLFSYAFTSIAFVILFWSVILYITLFHLIFDKKNKLFLIFYFSLFLIFWSMVNFWWIGQVFSYLGLGSFSAVASSSFTPSSNYNTFLIISQRLGNLIDLIRFKHVSFFSDVENIYWVSVYRFPIITFLEFIIAGIFLYPIVVKRREKEVLFFGGLFIFYLFFTKGNNPPLGQIFDQAFIKFSFLQLFRNPFEKIGFIIPLSATPLFCLGATLLIKKFTKGWGKIIYLFILFWLLVVWGFPFWSGLVFTSTEVPTNKLDIGYQVDVPSFYKDASSWLASQGNNFRLIVFPIGGEGITYSWSKGYSGVELSNQIFPVTSVSFSTNIPFYNEISQNLERIFLTRDNFTRIMNLLNAKFIVIRPDINWKIRSMRDPQSIENRLQEIAPNGELKIIKQFGDLKFWENSTWMDNTVYLAKGLIRVLGNPAIEDILSIGNNQDLVVYNGKDAIKSNSLVNFEIIKPVAQFGLGGRRSTDINLSDYFIFPTVKILPSQKLYPIIILKEKIEQIFTKDKNALILKKLSLLGKRLNEASIEVEKGQIKGSETALTLYTTQLDDLLPYLADVSKVRGDFFLLQEDVYKIFSRHFDRLRKINDAFPSERKLEVRNLEESLRKKLIDFKIAPNFGYLESQDFPINGRVVYQFAIEEYADYELLIDSGSWNKFFKTPINNYVLFQVDKETIYRKGIRLSNNLISYGFFNLSPGKHEIAWNTPEEINLVKEPAELNLNVEHGMVEKSFSLNNFDPYSAYDLTFDYLIKKGSGFEIDAKQNNDRINKGKLEPRFSKTLEPDTYDFATKNFTTYFIPSPTADNINLIFKAKPWNNCRDIFESNGKERCLNENFRKPYDRSTEVVVSNISFTKTLTEIPFLIKENNNFTDVPIPKINYQKVNASEYKVKIEGAKEQYILILSQLFDPAWKVLKDGKELKDTHFLANTYANGWIINDKGSYELSIKFIPQNLLATGEKTSMIIFSGGLILFIWKFYLKNDK